MHDSRAPHLAALKRILCYIKGILDYGLSLTVSSYPSLTTYLDIIRGCPDTRRLTSGYCIILGSSLVPGPLNAKSPHLVPVRKPSIGPQPTQLPRLYGIDSSWLIAVALGRRPPWFVVTSLPSISHPLRFIISAFSKWKLTYILFAIRSLLAFFVSYTFHSAINLLIYLPRVFQLLYFDIFCRASTFVMLSIRLQRLLNNILY